MQQTKAEYRTTRIDYRDTVEEVDCSMVLVATKRTF